MKPICLMNLSGGLGEGLQCFAALYSVAKCHDLEYFVIGHKNWLKWNTDVPGNSVRPAKDVTGWIEIFKDQYRVKLFDYDEEEYHNPNMSNPYINHITLNNNISYSDLEISKTKINRLLGYNFDTRSWCENRHEIRNCLNLQQINLDENITVVHIRRTDWVNAHWSFIDLCDTQYYINAINQAGNTHVIFVTDDIDYVNSWFASVKSQTICECYEFFEGNPIDSFYFMCNAKHLVISQSNFSRWPAYLSDYNIYYPELFFKDQPGNRLELCQENVQFYLNEPKWKKIKYIKR